MHKVEEKTAQSLSANGAELLPYLPYMLQDLWELGSNPEDIIELIKKNIPYKSEMKVLDLACGKGAVSIKLAQLIECSIKGIDIISEFIGEANIKAKELNIYEKCEYIVGDINEAIEHEKNYDIVILGAVGEVLGTPIETIQKLKKVVSPQGYIILVDAYARDNPTSELRSKSDVFPLYSEWISIFKQAEVVLVEARSTNENKMAEQNEINNSFIIKRAGELKKMHPDKQSLFEEYVQNQLDECLDIEENIVGVTWLLKERGHL